MLGNLLTFYVISIIIAVLLKLLLHISLLTFWIVLIALVIISSIIVFKSMVVEPII
jgi:hypothetical protein